MISSNNNNPSWYKSRAAAKSSTAKDNNNHDQQHYQSDDNSSSIDGDGLESGHKTGYGRDSYYNKRAAGGRPRSTEFRSSRINTERRGGGSYGRGGRGGGSSTRRGDRDSHAAADLYLPNRRQQQHDYASRNYHQEG